MAGAVKTKGGVSEKDAAKSELEAAKNLRKASKVGPGLKNHPLNPLRIIASGKNTNFSGFPEDDKLTKAKKKYKDKFPELVKNYRKGGRVTGGRVAKGCGAVMSDRRKKTKYF